MSREKIQGLVLCALFAALTALFSQVAIPIGPVPINLATFSVFCAGALLGAKRGLISQGVYVLLGLVGTPVFAMFKGGPGVIAGPTGGYIIGYILTAFVVGLIAEKSQDKLWILVLAMLAGFFSYMILGTLWYMISTKNGLIPSLMVCVVPFLLGDVLKIVAAALLSKQLKPILSKTRAFTY